MAALITGFTSCCCIVWPSIGAVESVLLNAFYLYTVFHAGAFSLPLFGDILMYLNNL